MILAIAWFTFIPINAEEPTPPDFSKVEKLLQFEIQSLKDKTTPKELQKHQILISALNSITAIKVYLESNHLENLEQQFPRITNSYLPPELVTETTRLQIALSDYNKAIKKYQETKRYQQIDALIKKVQTIIQNGSSIGELESMLVEITAADRKQSSRYSNSAIAQRYKEKRDGLAFTVRMWVRYYDFKEAGNPTQANAQLQQIARATTFPVISKQTIDQATMPLPLDPNKNGFLASVMIGAESISDIPKALKKIEELAPIAQKHNSVASKLNTLKKQLISLTEVLENINNGDGDFALSVLRDRHLVTNSSQLKFDSIICELEHVYLKKKDLIPSDIQLAPHESARLFLSKVFTRELIAKNYQKALLTATRMDLFSEREPLPKHFREDLSALQSYVTGQKMEASQDFLSALTYYRKCATNRGALNAPTEEAQKAITRIAKEHPDIMTNTEAALIQRLDRMERKFLYQSRYGNRR